MNNFREYNQAQGVFRPIIPNDLLEPEHPARVIDRVVELLDLKVIYDAYKEEGNPPYHPKMMLKVLFYSYCTGIMSSRKMWKGLKDRADYIFLSGDQVPNFRTINNYRTRHMEVLADIFTQIVHLCVKLGMVEFEHLAIDGEKVHANASYHRSKNKKRLEQSYERVKEGIEKLLGREVNEDFTEEKKGERIKRLRKQEKELLGLKRELEGMKDEKATINMTDKEAPVMKHKDGRSLPSYNHQSAVDGLHGVTCAVKSEVEPDKADDLLELVDKAKENTGGKHANVTADSAFCDYETLQEVEEDREENFLLPDKRFETTEKDNGKKGKYDISHFEAGEDGVIICPEGQAMKLKTVNRYEDGHTVSIYEGTGCGGCIFHDKCTKGKKRTIAIDSREPYRKIMREKLRSDNGREVYMSRQGIVEPVHGDDQKNKGWRQHHMRGLGKASLEFMLIRIGSNLGKIARYRAQELLLMPVSTPI
jgi:transposase